MRIAVTGASGMVGTALTQAWTRQGRTVVPISRHPAPGSIAWYPDRDFIDHPALEGFDAVVNLAGESLAAGRWTRRRKQRIRASRVDTTTLLCRALAALRTPPRVLVSVSAVGYYGDRGDDMLDETAAPGADMLSRLCVAWEAACEPAIAAGIRVVHPRFGAILSAHGGLLPRTLAMYRLGLGGRLGDGRQWMSWITMTDVIRAIDHLIDEPALIGPVNLVAPHPIPNADFARTLGRVLGRPARLAVPAIILRLALGELADALLLASQRCTPAILSRTGFQFRDPELEPALRTLLNA